MPRGGPGLIIFPVLVSEAFIYPSSSEPNIYHYTNYRTFLRDFYEYQKSRQPIFSYRYFVKKAGLKSPNHLKMVIDGKRNLSKKTITRFLVGFGLKGEKAEFFENLAFFNQSSTTVERNAYYQKILKVRTRLGLRKLDEAQLQLFSDWRNILVRELTAMKGFRANALWIAGKLGLPFTTQEARESLNLLCSLGLLKKTANGYTQSDVIITTADEVRSHLVKNYHRQLMQKGMEALDREPSHRRDVSSLTLAIQKKDFPKVKEHIQLMRKELLNFTAEPGTAEDIVQVNIQMFPLISDNE